MADGCYEAKLTLVSWSKEVWVFQYRIVGDEVKPESWVARRGHE
jgi:hypothetical protein